MPLLEPLFKAWAEPIYKRYEAVSLPWSSDWISKVSCIVSRMQGGHTFHDVHGIEITSTTFDSLQRASFLLRIVPPKPAAPAVRVLPLPRKNLPSLILEIAAYRSLRGQVRDALAADRLRTQNRYHCFCCGRGQSGTPSSCTALPHACRP